MTMLLVSFRLPQIAKSAAVAAALLFLGVPGARAHDMANMEGTHNAETFRFGEPGKASKVTRTINIAMKDISFEPASLTIKTGETIRFVVTNVSEIDHDFTLGDVATQTAHRKEMAEMIENGGDMHHSDPNAITVKAHESKVLIWKFSRAGNFEFDCNIPGHFESGMAGVIAVVDKAHRRAGAGATTAQP
ncbi:MAG: cupredoxin family protein [Azospirillaceae bacterium]|nr:cupredoxin family protein [Azospirillaceae bacterium]